MLGFETADERDMWLELLQVRRISSVSFASLLSEKDLLSLFMKISMWRISSLSSFASLLSLFILFP